MDFMQIGEVARQVKMPASTIRYYERIGLLPKPQRKNGRRLYQTAVLTQIRFIRAAAKMGYTLEEIKALDATESAHVELSVRWQAQTIDKLAEIEQKITRLNEMKAKLQESLECRCVALEDCEVLAI